MTALIDSVILRRLQSMDGDLLRNLARSFDLIQVVQIANHPGLAEPEIGEINMAAVLTRVFQLGYRGLVELERVWARPDLDAERRALDWLRRADATLASIQAREEPRPIERTS
jgi:hydroxypyruvate isomerase